MTTFNMRNKYVLICFVFLMLAFPNLSHAEKAPLTPEYQKCLDAIQDNMGWSGCGYDEIKRQEVFLDEAYKRVVDSFKAHASRHHPHSDCTNCTEDSLVNSLSLEQKNWEAWKDSACQYYKIGRFGRETEVLAFPACKASVVAERVAALKNLAEIVEDMNRK